MKWIKITDKIPPHYDEVLFYVPFEGVVYTGYLDYEEGFYFTSSKEQTDKKRVTHWMPIPELPIDFINEEN